jgi:hypothetical protein
MRELSLCRPASPGNSVRRFPHSLPNTGEAAMRDKGACALSICATRARATSKNGKQ